MPDSMGDLKDNPQEGMNAQGPEMHSGELKPEDLTQAEKKE